MGHPPGGGGGGGFGCTLDGVIIPCDFHVNQDAVVEAPRNQIAWDSRAGEWQFFRAYADGSAGWQPMSLVGNSPAEIAAIQAEMDEAKKAGQIDHASLSDWQKELLTRLASILKVDPATIQIYRASSGSLFALLPAGSYQVFDSLRGGTLSGFSNDSFLHGSYSVGLREITSNGRDSLHISMLDFSLSQRFGGGSGVFATWHNDNYNPSQHFWKHTFCDVLKFCH